MASVSDIQREVSDMSFDYMFKILIIGNSTVGKTALLFRYCDDTFTPAFVPTVGIDFKVKTINFKSKKIKLQLWDTAGQERYRTITTTYYRGAMGFLMVYDITKEESFLAVRDWATQVSTYAWENAQVILVGNKCDLEDERVISTDQGKQLAEELGMTFIETSAKENLNIDKTVHILMEKIVKKINEEGISEDAFTMARLGQSKLPSTPTIKPKGCDC